MKDYGASLVWPQPPKALTATAKKFQVIRYMIRILKQVLPSQFKLKYKKQLIVPIKMTYYNTNDQ